MKVKNIGNQEKFKKQKWLCHGVCLVVSIKHWKSIIRSMIEADRNTIKIADLKTGKGMTGKSIDSQVVFYFNDEKVTLHCFNTSQLI